jgi:hypothetical protein
MKTVTDRDAGFSAGIRVEKGQLASAATSTTTSAAQAGAPSQGATATRLGPRAGFPGAARGGGNASIGTVSSVNGKRSTSPTQPGAPSRPPSPSPKITKSKSVSKASVRAGDVVLVQGLNSSNGTIPAISVSESGVSATHSDPAIAGSGGNTTNTDAAG